MVLSTLLARRFPLRMGEAPDVTQVVTMWEDFAIADEPSPEAGPVAVEIAYRIRPEETEAFLDSVIHLRAPRRRDGATFWRLYRDLAEPTRYVERFIVTSWADYLHQRARATLADQELEAGCDHSCSRRGGHAAALHAERDVRSLQVTKRRRSTRDDRSERDRSAPYHAISGTRNQLHVRMLGLSDQPVDGEHEVLSVR
jgi:hypothetical protein